MRADLPGRLDQAVPLGRFVATASADALAQGRTLRDSALALATWNASIVQARVGATG